MPSMFIAHDPQIPSRQLRRNAKVGSCVQDKEPTLPHQRSAQKRSEWTSTTGAAKVCSMDNKTVRMSKNYERGAAQKFSMQGDPQSMQQKRLFTDRHKTKLAVQFSYSSTCLSLMAISASSTMGPHVDVSRLYSCMRGRPPFSGSYR